MIECPKCGCLMQAIRTESLRTEIIRLRQCRGCGNREFTEEKTVNYAEAKELWDGLNRERMRKRNRYGYRGKEEGVSQ